MTIFDPIFCPFLSDIGVLNKNAWNQTFYIVFDDTSTVFCFSEFDQVYLVSYKQNLTNFLYSNFVSRGAFIIALGFS